MTVLLEYLYRHRLESGMGRPHHLGRSLAPPAPSLYCIPYAGGEFREKMKRAIFTILISRKPEQCLQRTIIKLIEQFTMARLIFISKFAIFLRSGGRRGTTIYKVGRGCDAFSFH